MKKLSLYLENCYGIKKLEYSFDFENKKTFTIYAPNGVMKTSFSKSFKDLSEGNESKDLVFPEKESKRVIQYDYNIDLSPEEVFVIKPYDDKFNSEKISTLVVNKELKYKYDNIHKLIDKEKDTFFKKLKQLSGMTGKDDNIEVEIEKIFGKGIFDVFEDLEKQIEGGYDNSFSSITYNQIFNDKVLSFLNTKDFKKQIKDYIDKYNEIISKSTFLKRDFNHYNASTIQKNLNDNGFFKAQHSVNLFDGKEKQEISDSSIFEETINKEKEKVLNDKDLLKKFDAIDKKISNAQLRTFRNYLFDNKEVLPFLEDLKKLKENIFISYFIEQKELFKRLLDEYRIGKEEIKKIIEKAKKELTDWERAVNEFNTRFNGLPFKLDIQNKDDVILKTSTPTIEFIFSDSIEEKLINRENLLEVLSQGERRALYLLNVIFEVEARKKISQKTIFIVDDIADSFDYKNKYAIVEYLKDISKIDFFYQIILTHNFDFFRTIQERVLDTAKWKNSLIAQRNNDGIVLIEAGNKYITNPFSKWKTELNNDLKYIVPAIPFIRNLIEYRDGNECTNYMILTHLLHHKNERVIDDNGLNITIKNTNEIVLSDLEPIFSDVLKNVNFEYSDSDKNKKIIDVIYELSDSILLDSNVDEIILENKIILSIATRLKAEKFMWSKVNNQDQINGCQTGKLYQRYKDEFDEEEILRVLESVNIMTPENIHINSFMYEPILDMGIDDLKSIYERVKLLA